MRIAGGLLGVVFLVACSDSSGTQPLPHPGPDGGDATDAAPGSADAATATDAATAIDAANAIDAAPSPDAGSVTGCTSLLRPPMNPIETSAARPWHRCGGYGSGTARSLRIAANGSRVVAITDAGDAFVLAMPSLALVRTFTHANNRVSFAVLSADGSRLATVDDPHGEVAIWNVGTGALERTLVRSGAWPSLYGLGEASFSPDGSHLAVISVDHLDVWDLATGNAEPISARTDLGGGMRVIWAGNDRLAIARFTYWGNGPYSGYGKVDLLDARTGDHAVRLAYDFAIDLPALSVSSDGTRVAISAANGDRAVAMFDTATGAAVPIAAMTGAVLQLSADAGAVALSANGVVSIRATATGAISDSVPVTSTGPLAIDTDLQTLLVGDAPPSIVTATQMGNHTLSGLACGEGGKEVILNVELSPDGTRLITNDVQDVDRVWDVATGALLTEAPPTTRVYPSSISPDGTLVAVPDDAHTFHTETTASMTLVRTYGPHETHVDQLDWSDDAARIASGASRDPADRWQIPPQTRVWMSATGDLEQALDSMDSAPGLFAGGTLFVGDAGATTLWCR